jgi:hypothetical protein
MYLLKVRDGLLCDASAIQIMIVPLEYRTYQRVLVQMKTGLGQ